jgi:hypothetical protein
MKELVSIRPLVQKAKDELRALAASEIRLRETHDEILRRALTLGSYLCELKENVRRQICLNSGARTARVKRMPLDASSFTGTIRIAGIPAITRLTRSAN